MKNLFISFTVLFLALTSYAQLHIVGDCTDLSGNCIYYASKDISLMTPNKSKGFTIQPSIRMVNGKLTLTGIISSLVNIGTCVENNTFIMLLDDGSKITLRSWNKFNCEGDAYFNLNDSQIQMLRAHKIVKAQMQNGYSYESYQNDIPLSSQDYFLRLFVEIDANKYKAVK